jgi:hypothetical protein
MAAASSGRAIEASVWTYSACEYIQPGRQRKGQFKSGDPGSPILIQAPVMNLYQQPDIYLT